MRSRFIYEGSKRDEDEDDDVGQKRLGRPSKKNDWDQTELNPEEIRKHFRQLWVEDPEIMCHLYPMLKTVDTGYKIKEDDYGIKSEQDEEEEALNKHPTDVFFVECLAVPPPKTRPCQFMAGTMTIHPQSSGLQYVVETATVMREILRLLKHRLDLEGLRPEVREMIKTQRGENLEAKLDFTWKELQSNVDQVLDKELKTSTGNKVGWGFKQLIERKSGLFRMHMMGKRVNFAARTVITPDPNINIDEVGLPEVFAKSLTYREAVTPYNVDMLRDMVMNGPDVHPGNESHFPMILTLKNHVLKIYSRCHCDRIRERLPEAHRRPQPDATRGPC